MQRREDDGAGEGQDTAKKGNRPCMGAGKQAMHGSRKKNGRKGMKKDSLSRGKGEQQLLCRHGERVL